MPSPVSSSKRLEETERNLNNLIKKSTFIINKFNDENKNKKYYGLKKDKATAQTSKKMRDLVMKWR